MSKYTTNAACPSVVLQLSHRSSRSMYATDDNREKCYCNLDAPLNVQVSPLRSHEYRPKIFSPLNVSGRTYLFPPHCSRTASETSLIVRDVNEVLKRDVNKVLDRQLYLHAARRHLPVARTDTTGFLN